MANVSVTPSSFLPLRRVLFLLFGFSVAVILAHGLAKWAGTMSPIPLGIGKWFPVAYGHPRIPSVVQIIVAVLSIVGFGGAIRLLPRLPERSRYFGAAFIGFLAILSTTATQGIERGFVHPVAGREPHAKPVQYWHDAEVREIKTGTAALHFVRDYQTIQPTLAEHGRTHPPGAILLFALLRQASGNRPAIAAMMICLIGVSLVAIGFRLANAPPFAIILFCALPAVQVYFCATLDAVIAGLLFLVVVMLTAAHSTPPPGTLWAAVTLIAASFLTFGVLWVVPVLFAVEIARTRRFPWRTVLILFAIVLFYFVLYALTGFDYVAAFRFASRNENPDGFRLLVNPVEYVATRLENIADLFFFAGPFALWAIWRGLPVARREAFSDWVMFLAGVTSLGLLFLAGAYRTGETARACLFLYPLLVLVAIRAPLSERDRETLLLATFGVSAVLQCTGFYFW